MRQTLNLARVALVVLLSAMFLQLTMLAAGAQSTGNQTIQNISKFSIAQGSAVIYLNSSLAIPFNVSMLAGTPGKTYILVANGAALQANGIYVGINPGSGVPPFNGTLYINTNVKPGLVPGVYNLLIESGGADPIYPGIFNFTLTVYNTVAPSTTTVSTAQTTSYSVTSAPTTIAQKQSQSNLLGMGAAVLIVILVIILIVFLAIRAKRR